MVEVAALAFIVSVAFVMIAKTVPDHDPKGWKRIRDANRVYYMQNGHHG